jgi:hypothetical protein
MKIVLLASAVGALITLAGCAQSPRESAALSGRLDCPETRGQLTLISRAEDGRSCRYKTRDGADVELRLVPVQGGPKATLARLEAELSNLTPPENVESAVATPSQAEDVQATAALAASTVAQAEADAGGDNVRVRMPGGKVDANDESVSIALPGLKIDASEDEAQVKIGPINIDADDDGATVRIYREVRLRGESLARERRGIRATYILAGGRQPGGTTYVGLEAGGPKTGPLTVAIVSAAHDGEDADILDDIQDLVRENGGV